MFILKFFLGMHYLAQYGTMIVLCALALLVIVKLPGKTGALIGAGLFTAAGFVFAYNMGYRDRGKECNVADLTRKVDEQNLTIQYQGGLLANARADNENYRKQVDDLNAEKMKDGLDIMLLRKSLRDMAQADPKDAVAKPSPIIMRAVRGK